MEPTSNPRLRATFERLFYNMTRRYGTEGYLYKQEEASVDRDTGVKSEYTERVYIRNIVKAPFKVSREVIYTPSMMQSIRSSAWQGGGDDAVVTSFLLYRHDVRNWGTIETDQWILFGGKSYQVVEAHEVEGGWIVQTKRAEGSGPTE